MAAFRKNMSIFRRVSHISKKLQPQIHFTDSNNCINTYRFSSDGKKVNINRLELFLQEDVHNLLKKITGYDSEKLYRRYRIKEAKPSNFQLLSDTELQMDKEKSEKKTERRLQMPPFMSIQKETKQFLSAEPDLAPVLDSKYVFYDISQNKRRDKHERIIVCRHETGELWTASSEERSRILQIYHSMPDRHYFMPRMFQQQRLEEILACDCPDYVYILERACVQFDPDSPDFHRVVGRLYEHIAEKKQFEELRSTRFFGHMAFYFCWYSRIDALLLDMLQTDRMDDAIDLVKVFIIVEEKTTGKTISHEEDTKTEIMRDTLVELLTDDERNIQDFIKNHSKHEFTEDLQAAFDTCRDNNNNDDSQDIRAEHY